MTRFGGEGRKPRAAAPVRPRVLYPAPAAVLDAEELVANAESGQLLWMGEGSEVEGIDPEDLVDGASLEWSGSAWRVKDAGITDAKLAESYALLAGRAGGQTLHGGTAASENLVLDSTAHATKGEIRVGSAVRLPFNTAVRGRNSIDTATRDLIKIGSGNSCIVGDALAGLQLVTNQLIFNVDGAQRWQIGSGGYLLPLTDASVDIGASTVRVKALHLVTPSIYGVTGLWRASTTQQREAARIDASLPVTTDATRTGRMVLSVMDWAATREAIRFEATGAAVAIGFLGTVARTRPGAYTLTGTATRTMPADPSTAYTGIDNAQAGTVYAKAADVEALRAVVSQLLGVQRQLLTDLGHTSGYGLLNA